jgi:FKBP-type peptidyl-prolyl cis-trans isomerase (trigger factor)
MGSGALFAELEQKLVGLAVGAESAFDMTFPEGYRVAALAGRHAKLNIKIARVSEAALPVVDAELFRVSGFPMARWTPSVRKFGPTFSVS